MWHICMVDSLSAGTLIDDRYRVVRSLGAGGMGVVYLVEHVELGSRHALKLIATPSRTMRERLLREGRLQAKLGHPHVVSVTDLVTFDGLPGLVLELVEGPTLAEVLAERRLTDAEVDGFGRALLRGVAAAHAHGMVHRDLKPANILLAVQDGVPVPKITDFGLAKALTPDARTPDMTGSGAFMGTPGYVAPEQIGGAATVDGRADLFSLAAVLFEAATGRPAFGGGDLVETLRRTKSGDVGPLDATWHALPARLRETITRGLAPSPDARFADAQQMLAAWEASVPAPTLERWEDTWSARPARDVHPSADRLWADTLDAEVVAHLERCIGCRIERDLFLEAFSETDDVPPVCSRTTPETFPVDLAPRTAPPVVDTIPAEEPVAPWSMVVGTAAVVALPVAYGVMSMLLGTHQSIEMMGFFGLALLLSAPLAAAMTAWCARGWWTLDDHGTLGLYVGPATLAFLGLAGSAVGFRVLSHAAAGAGPDTRALLVANGSQVALSTETAGWTLASLCLAAIVGLATVRRVGSAPVADRRAGRVALMLAVVLGAAGWAVDATLRGSAPASFLVWVMAMGSAACCGIGLPRAVVSPSDARVRHALALSAVAATVCAALAADVQHQRVLLSSFLSEIPGHPLDGVSLARDALGHGNRGGTLGWTALSLLVATVAAGSAQVWRPRPSRLSLVGGTLLVGILAVLHLDVRRQQHAVRDQLVPALQVAAVQWLLPELHLDPSVGGGRMRVLAPVGPFLEDDHVVAVGGVHVLEVDALVGHVSRCLCDLPDPTQTCTWAAGCLRPEDPVSITVGRMGEGQRTLRELSTVLGAR